jgi:hypothetical protein
MEEARSLLARKWPNVYIHWTTLNQRLDDTEENVEQRKVLEESEGVILPLSNTFYGGSNGFTRYDRNRILEFLCVGFPEEFSRLFVGPWRRGDTITVPKYITPKYLQIAMLRAKVVFYREKIKFEKQFLESLQHQHKSALRQLKELGEKEGE